MAKAAEYVPYTGPLVTRAEARASGAPRYFTGKPCPYGHVEERITANGTCRLCSNRMSNTTSRNNREKYNAFGRAWRNKNKDKVAAQAKAFKEKYPERVRERSMRWLRKNRQYTWDYYAANSERIKQRVRDWTANNPERVRATKAAWAVLNAHKKKEADRDWAANNPILARANRRNYRARKRAAEGSHTAFEILALFDKQRGRCAYCRKVLGKHYHADHIVPLANGGSNWISNIQLTCPSCNHRKNRTDPLVFASRLGRLL